MTDRARRRIGLGLLVVVLGAAGVLATGVPAAATDAVSRDLSSYVIVALHRFKMKNFSFAIAGNMGVSAAGGTLAYGKRSFFPDGTQLVSDVVSRVGDHATRARRRGARRCSTRCPVRSRAPRGRPPSTSPSTARPTSRRGPTARW
jgi:hypothetical protein